MDSSSSPRPFGSGSGLGSLVLDPALILVLVSCLRFGVNPFSCLGFWFLLLVLVLVLVSDV